MHAFSSTYASSSPINGPAPHPIIMRHIITQPIRFRSGWRRSSESYDEHLHTADLRGAEIFSSRVCVIYYCRGGAKSTYASILRACEVVVHSAHRHNNILTNTHTHTHPDTHTTGDPFPPVQCSWGKCGEQAPMVRPVFPSARRRRPTCC